MQPPSPELAWVGIFASFIATLTALINLYLFWRNRARLVFRLLSAERYFEQWKDFDIKSISWPGPPGRAIGIKTGDCRRALYIIEFEFVNKYPHELTIGRIKLDEWMFSDKYVPGMYPLKRDYRVFNLHSCEPTGLDRMVKIEPNSSYGLRIEIYEDADGPHWKSSHSRYIIEMPQKYKIEFYANGKLLKSSIKFPKLNDNLTHYLYNRNYGSLQEIDRWSEDLLGPVIPNTFGQLPPQGVKISSYKFPLRVRLKNSLNRSLNWLIYGKTYRGLNQPNRLRSFANKMRKERSP